MSEQTETPDRAAGMVRGGHDLTAITWDAVANWQCSLCHRVFEFSSEAAEDPCDVKLDALPRAEGTVPE